MALDRLIEKIMAMGNPTVMGLDPKLAYIPENIKAVSFETYGHSLEGAADALLRFNMALIDAVADIVPAVKPQAGFYELYGWQGVRALAQTIAYAHEKGMFVIADVKRGDIGSTMEAYTAGWLGAVEVGDEVFAPFDCDAMTVNGYLGSDCMEPLLAICRDRDKGVFILAKTSNPSSGDLQDVLVDDKPVYEVLATLCRRWGAELPGKYGYCGVGIVVGATYPAQLAMLRERFPELFFLVPGYGAQGGGAGDVAAAFDGDGLGAVVNASRSLMCAWQQAPGLGLAEATRAEALRMKGDLAIAAQSKKLMRRDT